MYDFRFRFGTTSSTMSSGAEDRSLYFIPHVRSRPARCIVKIFFLRGLSYSPFARVG